MIRANENLAAALARLNGNPDFEKVREWIDKSFQSELEGLIGLRPEVTEMGKGYCNALKDIREKFNDPRKLAEKFQK